MAIVSARVTALVAPFVPQSVRNRLVDKAIAARDLATGGPAMFAGVLQAWRPHLAASALAGAALLASRRRTRPRAAGLTAAGLVAAGPVVRRAGRRPSAAPRTGDVTVLSANVLHGRADTGLLAAMVAAERPDFVVLPEAGGDFRDKLMPLLDGLGYRAWVASGGGPRDGDDITVLVGERAGDVRVRSAGGMRVPHLEVTGGILGARTLYAVTPALRCRGAKQPGGTASWRSSGAGARGR
jgi:hypothetical protein